MRRGAGSNMNSTSFCSAFVKLNLASSNGCATWSMRNSVGRFLDRRPSLHCAMKPYEPGTCGAAVAVAGGTVSAGERQAACTCTDDPCMPACRTWQQRGRACGRGTAVTGCRLCGRAAHQLGGAGGDVVAEEARLGAVLPLAQQQRVQHAALRHHLRRAAAGGGDG